MTNSATFISRRNFFKVAAGATLMITTMGMVSAQAAKVNLSSGVAIQGYDPVAYFAQKMPIEGDASINAQYEGATYQFSTAANRDAFIANPVKFAPQYGGFCAYAVAKGSTASIDPTAFSVVDNKLYLNYSRSVKSRWEKDVPGHIKAANKNWPSLSAN